MAFRQGRSDEALASARNALLLGTADRETALLTIRLAIERGVPTPEILALLKGMSSAGFWEACKSCDRPDLFQALLDQSTASDGAISYKLVRPLTVAATRVENFSAARSIVIKGFEAFLKADRKADSGMRGSLGPAGLTALEDAAETLNAAGIRFFAAAGTALGIVREGAPLKHDVDIDIGIFEEDFDRQRLTDIFLIDPRFWPDAPHDKSPKIGLKHKSGASIDLFLFRKEGDAYYHDGVFVRWRNDIFELEPRKVGRATVKIPANADHYLTENYGDWRVPDKTFDAFVSGPNREITWPDYYGVHLLRAAFIAYTNGNMEKFHYMADQVQQDTSIPPAEKAFIGRIVEMAS
ncbi:MAG: hypothetical protein KIT02_04285 [Devosia sp.]|uniref:hypothetical protein n=1 Tax=Devosia sp. TaxID=1871048 RepID=UPI0024C8594D|nr:hypothetical protein [Devosia sp.]UYO00442.1 MAG: hypothetical protein KIT02_04285 [Devosia sp.]